MHRGGEGRVLGPGLRRAGAAAVSAAALAGVVTGCGSSSATATSSATNPAVVESTTSANDGIATSGTATSPQISRKLKAEEASVHRQVEKSLHTDPVSHVRYGSLPQDLRHRQRAPRNQVLFSTPGHPADAIQGIPIHLRLPSGATALATAVGPDVPTKDQGSFRNHTNATWDITFSRVHGTVPIAQRMITLTDELGKVLTPQLSVKGGGPVPRSVPHGGSFTLVLHSRTSIGDGKVRYTPQRGHLLAEWDFDAETD